MFYYLIACRYCWICKFIESLILSPPLGNGSDFAFDRGALDNDQLARVERASLQQGRIVVGGSHPGDAGRLGSCLYTDASVTVGRRFRFGRDGIGRQLPADAFLEGMVCVWE